uniref:NADH-ubiquinone oxidoreductase chain 5 n=1 Tax=Cyanopterus ninghais TaxID=3079913 RepID=A0AA96QBF8_9HYME|nr:NADH dehydrogenase subunit 5 [Cyanopterus ninghais]
MIFFMISIYMFMLNLISWLLFLLFFIFNFKFLIELNMFNFNSTKIIFLIYMDWMNLIFISTVLMISSIVIIYSINYMNNDLHIKRFMLLIIMFIMSMILMISSPNMISILLGWDGLGLSSYCLVAYYQSKKSFNSSMITIMMNRIGDIMILMTISIMIKFGTWNFLFINNMNFLILIMIFIASITKSAQIPFSTWLPLAMAAPTPVSSLVHSSTLVTAGTYLLIRFNYLMNKNIMYFFLLLSSLTMIMAGSSANFEFDLKKIIALSTLSQLGLMITTICLNLPKLAFFHLITHAMFKSLLFLCSGIMIHNYFNHQDIRFISMMNFNIPLINLIFNMSSLTLCGMPFLAGFYSKDLIIEMFLMNNFNWLIFMIMFLSMGLTISYTFRLIFYISLKINKIKLLLFYSSFNFMNYSIFILFFFSLFYGSILNWLMFSSMKMIFLPKILKMLIYIFLIIGLLLGMYLPMIFKFSIKIKYIYNFFNYMWFLPLLFKKNKINILKMNNLIIFFSENWLELISFKMFNYNLKIFYFKKNWLINFFMIFLMTNYILMIIIFL